MNERIFEQAVNTLSIAFMAGRTLVALSRSHAERGNEKKDEHGQTPESPETSSGSGLSMPPSYIESRPVVSEANLKALEEALAFIKKTNSAEEAFKQNHLSLSSVEPFEAYNIALETVHSEALSRSHAERGNESKDFGVFLKTIESTIEALLKTCNEQSESNGNGNVSADSMEDTRVFFSQLMHFASSKSSQLLMKEGSYLL